MTLEEAEVLGLSVLKQVMKEKINDHNVEVASVTIDKGFRIYSIDEVKQIVGKIKEDEA